MYRNGFIKEDWEFLINVADNSRFDNPELDKVYLKQYLNGPGLHGNPTNAPAQLSYMNMVLWAEPDQEFIRQLGIISQVVTNQDPIGQISLFKDEFTQDQCEQIFGEIAGQNMFYRRVTQETIANYINVDIKKLFLAETLDEEPHPQPQPEYEPQPESDEYEPQPQPEVDIGQLITEQTSQLAQSQPSVSQYTPEQALKMFNTATTKYFNNALQDTNDELNNKIILFATNLGFNQEIITRMRNKQTIPNTMLTNPPIGAPDTKQSALYILSEQLNAAFRPPPGSPPSNAAPNSGIFGDIDLDSIYNSFFDDALQTQLKPRYSRVNIEMLELFRTGGRHLGTQLCTDLQNSYADYYKALQNFPSIPKELSISIEVFQDVWGSGVRLRNLS